VIVTGIPVKLRKYLVIQKIQVMNKLYFDDNFLKMTTVLILIMKLTRPLKGLFI